MVNWLIIILPYTNKQKNGFSQVIHYRFLNLITQNNPAPTNNKTTKPNPDQLKFQLPRNKLNPQIHLLFIN